MVERVAVIFNRFSHKPLDVVGGSTAPGAGIQQYGYHGGDAQRWRIKDVGQGPVASGAHTMQTRFSISARGNAITVNTPDTVWQQPLAPSTPFAAAAGQLWALEELPLGSALDTRRYVIRNTRDDTVLGLRTDDRDDHVPLSLGAYQNKESQRWEIVYELDLNRLDLNDIMAIFNKNSAKCLDVPGATGNDIDIQQYIYNGGRNQF